MDIPSLTIKIISTFFYIGYLPLIPGTFASIAGVLLFYYLRGSIFSYVLFTSLLILLGFMVSGRAERAFKIKDARYIVIDEVSGMLLGLTSLLFVPYDRKLVIIGFVFFRILDALKPFPLDRIQSLKGSLGIMGDDIVAAIYTNIALQLVISLNSFRLS